MRQERANSKIKGSKTLDVAVVVPVTLKEMGKDTQAKVLAAVNRYFGVMAPQHLKIEVAAIRIEAKGRVRVITTSTTSVAEEAKHLVTKWIREALQANSWAADQVYLKPDEEPSIVARNIQWKEGAMQTIEMLSSANPNISFGPRAPEKIGAVVTRVFVRTQADLVTAFSSGIL